MNRKHTNPVDDEDMDSSSSSSSSEDEVPSGDEDRMDFDDEEEKRLEGEIETLNLLLSQDPYNYDAYVKKITILRKLGNLDDLRETREKFSSMYPLSPTLWLDWLRDETPLIENDEIEPICSLFEKAVVDYLSAELWAEYCSLMLLVFSKEDGPTRCREMFERALSHCGLHVTAGNLIWNSYRDLEEATEDKEKYESICRRQLSVPLLGMEESYESIKEKMTLDDETNKKYEKALNKLQVLKEWEQKLDCEVENDKSNVYKDYITFEKKENQPTRVICLYERAVADVPLDSSLWMDYLDYVTNDLKQDGVSVASRAVRNCPWHLKLWIIYMLQVERFVSEDTFEKIKNIFEKGIIYCSEPDHFFTLWMKYLEIIVRLSKTRDEDFLDLVRKTFDSAENHLLQLFPEPSEKLGELLTFRCRFETHLVKSMSKQIRSMWNSLLVRGYGDFMRVWIQYLNLERLYGVDINVASQKKEYRRQLSRAVKHIKDDSYTIAQMWLQFEQDFGDPQSVNDCEQIIADVLIQKTTKLDENENNKNTPNKPVSVMASAAKKRKAQSDDVPDPKRKRGVDNVDSDGFAFPKPVSQNKFSKTKQEPEVRRGETVKHDSSKDDVSVFISNLAYQTENEALESFFQDCGTIKELRLVRDYKGRSKGFGYMELSSLSDVEKALLNDRKPLNGRPVFVSRCNSEKSTREKKFRFSTGLEKKKLFVKGLPFSVNEEELRKLFEPYGELKEVRLVTMRNGHSKGLAYIEYAEESQASNALLKTDGMMVKDKTISVALSNPPSKSTYSSHTPVQRARSNPFVPRNVQIRNKDSSVDGSSRSNDHAPKSNSDFRKLFNLGK